MIVKPVITGDGKYKTINDNGLVTVYRNDIPWKTPKETAGDGYLLSLIQALEYKVDAERLAKIEVLEEVLKIGENYITVSTYEAKISSMISELKAGQ